MKAPKKLGHGEKIKYALSLLLVLAGILLASYPWLNARYEDRRQRQIVDAWKRGLAVLAQRPEESEADGPPAPPAPMDAPAGEEAQREAPPEAPAPLKNCLGMIRIPSIDLEIPLMKGATRENLRWGAATIEPTGLPGEPGNLAVAGHNYRGYGRTFNRLDQVKTGDRIQVETQEGSYIYTVTDIFTVSPEETQVLSGDGEKLLITLITCFPRDSAELRLIVRGELTTPEE